MDVVARSSLVSRLVGIGFLIALAVTIGLIWAAFWAGPEPYYFFDADFYRKAVVAVQTGSKTMYEAMAYPPFAYLLIWWLPSLPMVVGDQLWTAATFALIIVVAFVLAARAMEANRQDWRADRWGLIIRGSASAILLIISMPMASQLTCGQVSLLVIALPFLDLSGVIPRRYQGILVGLAAAIKVTPMIFGVYYLVTGQRRQAVMSVASFGAFTAFGALFFPAETWTFWTKLNSSGQEVDPLLVYNLGIRSALARISPEWAEHMWLWAGLGLFLLIATLWRARRLHLRGDQMEAMFIVAAAAIVVPPNGLPHYFTWLPMAALWLLMTGGLRAKVVGLAIYVLYSMAYVWVVLPWIVDDKALLALGVNVITVVPILMGVFGLPRRTYADPVSVQVGALADASTVH